MNFLAKIKTLVAGALIFIKVVSAQDTQILQLRPGPGEGYHSDIRTDNPAPNCQSINVIANAWTVGGYPFIQRSLLKFDLSQIPSDAVIIRANLSLFCNTTSGHSQLQSGENAAQLRRITQSWDPVTANWSNQPSSTDEGAVGLRSSITNTQDYPEIDVTAMVNYWHQNPAGNHGMLLRLMEESQYRCMVFASSHHPDASKRPLLEIEYTTCRLPYDFFRYTAQGLRADFRYADSTTTSWLWDFGDNSTSTLQNPTHQFGHAGRYRVQLSATNRCGSIRIADTVAVCEDPVADFNFAVRDQIVSFKSLSTGAEAWYWSFGNGFFSNLENPVYHYLQPGDYRVCLLVSNGCGSDISCKQLTVESPVSNLPGGQEPGITTAPNPTRGAVTIDAVDKTIYMIDICNSTGFLVKSIGGIDAEEFDIDLSDVEAGIYLIKVTTSDGEFTNMIVKE